MKYYIFRHGLTAAVRDSVPYGNSVLTAEILPEAAPAIEKLANFLIDIPSDFNVSSELQRCRQTVQIVEKITGKSFNYDARLNEPYKSTIGEIELIMKQFLEEMTKKNYKSIMICTHGAIISALKHLLTEGRFEGHHLLDYPQPGELLIIEDGSFQVKNFNEENIGA